MEKTNATKRKSDTVLASHFSPFHHITRLVIGKKIGGPHLNGGVVPTEVNMYEEKNMYIPFISIHWC
jgi:hypothetical protein